MICTPDQVIIPKKNKTGRKTIRLSKSMIKDIQSMISQGYLERQVWKALGISNNTWYKWKGRNNDLVTAIDNGHRVALIDVEGKLRDMALGNIEIKEIQTIKDPSGQVLSIAEKVKRPGPDFRAIQFSLVNGLPAKYRDEGRGDVNVTLLQAPMLDKTDHNGTVPALPSKNMKQVTGERTMQPVSALLPINAGTKRASRAIQDGKEQLSHGVKLLVEPKPYRTGKRTGKKDIIIEKKSPKGGGGGRGAARSAR